MLGVRRCAGVQIDLWQGDAALFVCDLRRSGEINAALREADERALRHLVLTEVGEPAAAMAQVRAYLESSQRMAASQGLGRITFVLPDLALYYRFQDALFEGFAAEEA